MVESAVQQSASDRFEIVIVYIYIIYIYICIIYFKGYIPTGLSSTVI